MKKVIITILLFLSPILFHAQNDAIMRPTGEIIPIKESNQTMIGLKKRKLPHQEYNYNQELTCPYVIDTLRFQSRDFRPRRRIGIHPQDYIAQYFIAPTNIKIKKVCFLPSNWACISPPPDSILEIRIVQVNLTEEQLNQINQDHRLGYYPAAGNIPNPISAFKNDPETSGEWVNVSGLNIPETFGDNIWPTDSPGINITPTLEEWNYINIDSIASVPILSKGDVFAIVIKNNFPFSEEDYDIAALALLSQIDQQNYVKPYPIKFYANGRPSDDDYGWWTIPENFIDIRLVVEFLGDLPPLIEIVEPIKVILPGKEQHINADILDCNPIGGEIGISEVWLKYKLSGNDFYDSLRMILDEEYYSVNAPYTTESETGEIFYHLRATDVNGNSSTSREYSYFCFAFTSDNLLIFNGFDRPIGFPQDYYFGKDDFENFQSAAWQHDTWSFGELPNDLLNNYNNIFEITTDGPITIDTTIIREWLESDTEHNYMLAGDEWMGTLTGWQNSIYQPGDFQYDILGIYAEKNDIVQFPYDSTYLLAVEGSMLGDALYHKQLEIENADSLYYNPNREISFYNYLDGVYFLPNVDVFMKAVFQDKIYNVGGSRILDSGNKIAFFAYDPLSINSSPEYYWFGFSASAPQVEALRWFGINVVTTTKIETEEIVNQFSLSQNYPNPFNPTTTIEYIIPNSVGDENFRPLRMVKLKVFDVLGREIKTLINKPMQPGKYKVEFDASELSSGVYFYTLSSGEFNQTKKFMLLK